MEIMERTWIILLLTCIWTESFARLNLNNGEPCLQSGQCKSGCCHRRSGLSMARCADKAAENQECSQKLLYGIYYRCPCEIGLTCYAGISNTVFGICKDPAKGK